MIASAWCNIKFFIQYRIFLVKHSVKVVKMIVVEKYSFFFYRGDPIPLYKKLKGKQIVNIFHQSQQQYIGY